MNNKDMLGDWFYKNLVKLAGWAGLGAVFSLLYFFASIEIKDLDLWFHLASGRFITANGFIPKVDVFSHTMGGAAWINHEWLFQIVVYHLYEFSGIDGWIYFRTALLFSMYLLLLALGFDKEKPLIPVSLLLLVFLNHSLRLTVRPDMVSLLYFVVFIYIMSTSLQEKKMPWILFFVQILWTNTHGFFIFGPLLLFILLLGDLAKRHLWLPWDWKSVGRFDDKEFKNLTLAFFLVSAACLINPNFIEGALYPLRILFSIGGESDILFQKIIELQQPITWGNLFAIKPYPYYRIAILVPAVCFLLNYRKIDLGAFLLWVIFLIFSLKAIRNMAFYGFVMYFSVLVNVHQIRKDSLFPIQISSARWRQIGSVLILGLLVAWVIRYIGVSTLRGYYDFKNYERKSEFDGGMTLRQVPHQAADFLITHRISGKILNDFSSGAFLLGRAHPQIEVFIDGRTELYGTHFIKNFEKIWLGEDGELDRVLKEHPIEVAFLNSARKYPPPELVRYFHHHPEWKLVYFDYDALIFLKDVPRFQSRIDRLQINLSQWKAPVLDQERIGVVNLTPYQHLHRGYSLYHLGLYDQAMTEIREMIKAAPHYSKAYQLRGMVYLKEGALKKASQDLHHAAMLTPSDVKTRFYLAKVLYKQGNFKEASKQSQRVIGARFFNIPALFLMAQIYAAEDDFTRAEEYLRRANDTSSKKLKQYIEKEGGLKGPMLELYQQITSEEKGQGDV